MGCASSRPAHTTSQRHRTRPSPETHLRHHTNPRHAPTELSSFDAYHGTVPAPTRPPPVARGRSRAKRAHAAYEPRAQNSAFDVSPPRNWKEMPRRHVSGRYRDVSPLAASRFNRPFERAKAGHGSNFEGRGVGGWEHW